jgi:hypothetical protein
LTIPPQISLGDYLRAAHRLGGGDDDEVRRLIALLLGFEWLRESQPPEPPPEPRGRRALPQTQPEDGGRPAPELQRAADERPDDAWVESQSSRRPKMPHWFKRVRPFRESARGEKSPPPLETLFLPAWTRILLQSLLGTEREGGALDTERVIAHLARAAPLAKLWRRRRLQLGRVQVLIDVSEAMSPFAEDQEALLEDITRIATAQMVNVLFFKHCPELGAGAGEPWAWRPYEAPATGTTVLLLTDLGARRAGKGGTLIEAGEWLHFTGRVRKAGCPLVALVPYPQGRVHPSLRKAMAVVPWDRSTTTGQVKRIRSRLGITL